MGQSFCFMMKESFDFVEDADVSKLCGSLPLHLVNLDGNIAILSFFKEMGPFWRVAHPDALLTFAC